MSEGRRDPYEVLGLTHDATPLQIRHAYAEQLRRFHPDTRPQDESRDGSAGLAQRLEDIRDAYVVLRRLATQVRGASGPVPTSTHRDVLAEGNSDVSLRVGPVRWHRR
jgi:hypothetical protein